MTQRIVVIEDDDAILALYTILFQEEGYEVYTSKTLLEMHEIEQLAPSLVLLDLRLGGHLSGFTLIEQMRTSPLTRHLPILVSTASFKEGNEHEEKLRREGITIVYKPFDVDELVTTIRKKLGPSGT